MATAAAASDTVNETSLHSFGSFAELAPKASESRISAVRRLAPEAAPAVPPQEGYSSGIRGVVRQLRREGEKDAERNRAANRPTSIPLSGDGDYSPRTHAKTRSAGDGEALASGRPAKSTESNSLTTAGDALSGMEFADMFLPTASTAPLAAPGEMDSHASDTQSIESRGSARSGNSRGARGKTAARPASGVSAPLVKSPLTLPKPRSGSSRPYTGESPGSDVVSLGSAASSSNGSPKGDDAWWKPSSPGRRPPCRSPRPKSYPWTAEPDAAPAAPSPRHAIHSRNSDDDGAKPQRQNSGVAHALSSSDSGRLLYTATSDLSTGAHHGSGVVPTQRPKYGGTPKQPAVAVAAKPSFSGMDVDGAVAHAERAHTGEWHVHSSGEMQAVTSNASLLRDLYTHLAEDHGSMPPSVGSAALSVTSHTSSAEVSTGSGRWLREKSEPRDDDDDAANDGAESTSSGDTPPSPLTGSGSLSKQNALALLAESAQLAATGPHICNDADAEKLSGSSDENHNTGDMLRDMEGAEFFEIDSSSESETDLHSAREADSSKKKLTGKAHQRASKGFNLGPGRRAASSPLDGVKRRLLPLAYLREFYLIEGFISEDDVSQSFRVRERKVTGKTKGQRYVARFFFTDKGRNFFYKSEARSREARTNPHMSEPLREQVALALLVDHPALTRSIDFFYHFAEDAVDIRRKVRSVLTGTPVSECDEGSATSASRRHATDTDESHLIPRVLRRDELGLTRKRVSLLSSQMMLPSVRGSSCATPSDAAGSTSTRTDEGFLPPLRGDGGGSASNGSAKDAKKKSKSSKSSGHGGDSTANFAQAAAAAAAAAAATASKRTPQQLMDALLLRLSQPVNTEDKDDCTVDLLKDSSMIYGVLITELVCGPVPPVVLAETKDAMGRSTNALEEKLVASYASQLCDALQYLHGFPGAVGTSPSKSSQPGMPTTPFLVHNNVRGEFVLLDGDGRIRLSNLDNAAWVTALDPVPKDSGGSSSRRHSAPVLKRRAQSGRSRSTDASCGAADGEDAPRALCGPTRSALPFPIFPVDLTAPSIYTPPELVHYVDVLRYEATRSQQRQLDFIASESDAAAAGHFLHTHRIPLSSFAAFAYDSPKLRGDIMQGISDVADCYQLGVTLYRLLVGQPPVPAPALSAAHESSPAPPASARATAAPRGRNVRAAGTTCSADAVDFGAHAAFGKLSADAQSLLRGLLTRSKEQRLTVEEVCAHPFVLPARSQ